MNGKIKAFYESQGLTVNKNYGYGVVRGYETNAKFVNTAWNSSVFGNNDMFPYAIHISFYASSDQKAQIESALRNAALKYFNFRITECGMQFSFGGMTNGSIAKRLPELFDTVFGIIADNGGKTNEYCPYCGELLDKDNVKKCEINGFTVTIESDCLEKINAVIESENAEFKAAPNNYLRGLAGAIIGGVAGAVVSVILLMVGYVAFISAIVSVLLGAFLYQKLGGKPDKMMLVIVGVVTLVFMALAVLIAYLIICGMAVSEAGVNMGAFEAFTYFMGDKEIANGFYFDLGMSMLFAVIGMVIEIVIVAKNIKRKKRIN